MKNVICNIISVYPDDIVYGHNRNSPSILASVELVDVATAPAVTQFLTISLNVTKLTI